MKVKQFLKSVLGVVVVFGLLGLVGCLEEDKSPTGPTEEESYFPLSVGSSWTYRSPDGSTKTLSIQSTRKVGADTYYQLPEPNPSSDLSYFREASDGIKTYVGDLETPFGQFIVAARLKQEMGEGVDIEVVDVNVTPSGEWLFIKLPLEAGSKWDIGTMEVSYIMTMGQTAANANTTVSYTAEAVKSETIRVPAGEFDTVNIDWTQHTLTVMEGVTVEEDRFDASSWYAKGIGEVQYEDENALVQLMSYEIK